MRHRVKSKKLNRDTHHRKALFRNLVRSLVEHGSITTTEIKAKEAKRIADKLIGKSKDNSLATRRELHSFFGKRDVVNTLVDQVGPTFTKQPSGFTKITKLGTRRGDNAQMAKLELVEKPEKTGSLRNTEAVSERGKVAALRVKDKTKQNKAKATSSAKTKVVAKATVKAKSPAKKATNLTRKEKVGK